MAWLGCCPSAQLCSRLDRGTGAPRAGRRQQRGEGPCREWGWGHRDGAQPLAWLCWTHAWHRPWPSSITGGSSLSKSCRCCSWTWLSPAEYPELGRRRERRIKGQRAGKEGREWSPAMGQGNSGGFRGDLGDSGGFGGFRGCCEWQRGGGGRR